MSPTTSMAPKFCGGLTRRGTACERPAGWGTGHPGAGRCKNHGGASPSGEVAGARDLALAYAAERMGVSDLQPTDALLMCVRDTAAFVVYCKRKVAEQGEDGIVKGDDLSVWPRLQRQATRDLAKFSESAIRAGVAERQIRLAERMGELLAEAMERVLAVLDLSPKDRAKAVRTFGQALAELEAGEVVEGSVAP